MKKLLFFIFAILLCGLVSAQTSSTSFPKWEKGYLDIHHINTGRGNCTFVIMPDGTTMMIDAGDFDVETFNEKYAPMYAPRIFPNSSYTAGTAIANYVINLIGRENTSIDYFLLTHFHSDHYGSIVESSGTSEKGGYRLSGLTEVGDIIPIKTYIDRAYPDYDYPVKLSEITNSAGGIEKETFSNLMKFIDYQKKNNGMVAEKFDVGSNSQIVLKKEQKNYPEFEIRNIKSENRLWTGEGKNVVSLFTKEQLLGKDGRYNGNLMSTAIVIKYGKFRYYSGGDNPGLVDQDREDWCDVETPMSKVIGKVSAMSLDHHSNRDATNRTILETLDPKIIVAHSWSPDHPGAEVGNRLISSNIGTRKRDIFMTYYNEETGIAIGPWFARNLKCRNGHVVIRVSADGTYNVYVLDSTKDTLVVKDKFGPYID